jgi:haloalkane dehalogenase
MPTLPVLDSSIHYETAGTGVPVVFLHGNPTSSYLWRKVTPHVSGMARTLAPDLIGMGASGKPDIAYGLADSARYLAAWFDALDLRDVVLVGHDWGGVLALDFAARNPGRVRGVALLETFLKPLGDGDLSPAARERFVKFRTPGLGEELVLEQNIFIETAFKGAVLNPLSEEEVGPYREPFPTPETRRPMLAWARSLPFDGAPADVTRRIEEYGPWLTASADVPKLLLTFSGSPTLAVGEDVVAWSRANIAALDVRYVGPAGHHAPEDQPDAIGTAVAEWLVDHELV